MSFWDTVGEVAQQAAKFGVPAVGVLDAARVAATAEDPAAGRDGITQNAMQFGNAFFKPRFDAAGAVLNSSPVQAVLGPLNWGFEQASHGLATAGAVGGILSDSGQTGIDTLWSRDLWDADTWTQAWQASEGVSGGEAIAYQQLGALQGKGQTDQGRRWWDQNDRAEFEKTRKETGFKLSAGAIDILATWYADPTLGAAKVAKAARAGSRIVDAAQAEEVASVLGKGMEARTTAQRAAGKFSTAPEETASRLYDNVAKTDNMGYDEIAAHFKENLERTGDAGPLVGILGQASKIEDLELQRLVKADVLLAGAGSAVARDRLITNAPHLARAVQRASLPPESFQIVDEMVQAGVTGEALLKAANRWANPANAKELSAYAKELDDIHTRISGVAAVGRRGGVENVSGTVVGAVKSKYRAGMAREFYFQPGPHSRTVRVVHWATGQRMKGVIAVDDAVRGHDELMDTLTRSGLFSAEQRKAISEKWWQAPNKTARSDLAQALPEIILNKLAAKHFGGDRDLLDHTIRTYRGWAASARTYTTKQMEAARANNLNRVVLEDPMTGTPTSIDRALFETHIENNVAIPDVKVLERLVRHAKDARTAGDRVAKSGEWALKTAEDANDLWRTLTLARPGFIVRTQLDTQARTAMTVGATTLMLDALRGLGHKFGDIRAGRLTGADVVEAQAKASDLLRSERLRAEAAQLRKQAEAMTGGPGQRLVQRAKHLEAEAEKAATYTVPARRLVSEERTVKVRGQQLTTRAASSQQEAEALKSALHTGDVSLSEAILRVEGQYKLAYTENARSWVTTMPEAPEWTAAWLRSKDAMVQSKAGRAILQAMDEPSVDMVRHLRSNPEVRDAWRAVRERNPEFDSWLDRAIAQVEWTAPTPEIRKVLMSGKQLTPADVDRLFKPAKAVTDKVAVEGAYTAESKSEPLRARIEAQRERVAAADRKVERARRDDTRAKHEAARERAEGRLATLEQKLDDVANPPTVAPEHVGLADRMPVHAPEMDVLDPTKGIQTATDLAKKMVGWMSDVPDTVLGRIPFYTERYFTHFRELAAREIDRAGEVGLEARARIEEVAKHRAIQDTRRTMYDTARHTGAHDRVARMAFAFIGAWEDAMRAWGRMFYDDPSRLGKLIKLWNAPDRLGMVTDENGNVVHPGDEARERWLTLPVDWVPGVDFKEFRIRKDSFNSMFQGEVPWMPGLGPGVQVPVTQIAARTFPELADPDFEIGGVKVGENPVLRQVFGFGLPKTGATGEDQAKSMLEQVTPGWVKRARSAIFGNDQQFYDAYAMAMNTEIMKARDAGKNVNDKAVIEQADKVARKTARSMMFLEFVSNFGLGLSGEGSTKADFYRQQYRQIVANADKLAAQGRTPAEEMLRLHPEAAGLEWSFSQNATGINATLKVEDRIRKYGRDIQKNPEFGWFYVGSDNVGGEFSAASYTAQFGREAEKGSGDTWRRKMDTAEIRQKTAASLGWDDYYKIKDQVDAELMNRGLHSLQQRGAKDLAEVMRTFKAQLAEENPEWWSDYNSFDADQMQSFLSQVARPALKDGRLKNRSDIRMMAEYLDLRQQAMDMANASGYSLGSRSARDLRAVLMEAGNQMAQENIGFSQMWQRVFQREIDLAADAFPADDAAASAFPSSLF